MEKKLTTGSFGSRLARQQHIDQQSAFRCKHTVAAFASVCVNEFFSLSLFEEEEACVG